jgi:hypothetical protein
MAVACGAHVLHDGYTDLFYVLLPIWQAECGLGYAEIGALRALYGGSMASFQVPAGIIAERLGGPLILGLGTALAGEAAEAGQVAAWPGEIGDQTHPTGSPTPVKTIGIVEVPPFAARAEGVPLSRSNRLCGR